MKTVKLEAYKIPRRRHFPAWRNDMALELRIVKNRHRQAQANSWEKIATGGVLIGLRSALRMFTRNTAITQQTLWSQAADEGTYRHDPPNTTIDRERAAGQIAP